MEGELYRVSGDGNRSLIEGEAALRKHEVVELKVDWLMRRLVVRRRKVNAIGGMMSSPRAMRDDDEEKDIVLNLSGIQGLLDIEWTVSCSVCVNDVESFMWNGDNDKDFITYTVDSAYIL